MLNPLIATRSVLKNKFPFQPLQNSKNQLIQKLYGRHQAKRFFDFCDTHSIEQFLSYYKTYSKVKHKVSALHFGRIPQEKSLLVLANHSTGIPDGLLILDTLLKKRKDVKILLDHSTYPSRSLQPFTIGVHLDNIPNAISKNAIALKQALKWLEDGHCLVLFSNSEVLLNKKLYKSDKESFWHPSAKKIILKHKGFILPWAIRGKNSPLFYFLSNINPKFRQNLIPRESLRRRFRPIESAIGKPFKASEDHSFIDLELKIRLMSKRQFGFEFPQLGKFPIQSKFKTIANEIDASKIKSEIISLGTPIVVKGQNEVYLSPPKSSPNILLEIGRLREITFREVGEGSGLDRDLDKHDEVFYHLVLWDSSESKIVGAYRLGIGPDLQALPSYRHIIYDYYIKNAEVEKVINKSIILGRAFVRPEYQQKPFPLFLLWNGILAFVEQRNDINYLIGQTSLSNSYQSYSKLLITEFLWKHFSDKSLRDFFVPIHPFKAKRNSLIQQWISLSKPEDIKRMDKIIECIEPSGVKTPMLFKRYIEQRAKCIGINVDPDFQNSIDILMLTDLSELSRVKS